MKKKNVGSDGDNNLVAAVSDEKEKKSIGGKKNKFPGGKTFVRGKGGIAAIVILIILAAVCAVVVVFLLSGSGKKQINENESSSTAETESQIVFPEDLSLVNSGELSVATNATFPPFESENEDGAVCGIDMDLSYLIANYPKTEINVENLEYDEMLSGVKSGKYDMAIAGISDDDLKNNDFIYSVPYASVDLVVLVPDGTSIKDTENFKSGNYKIGVIKNTTANFYASKDFGDDRIKFFTSVDEIAQKFNDRTFDSVILQRNTAENFLKRYTGVHLLDGGYKTENYYICFAKNNVNLKNSVDMIINKLKANGSIDSVMAGYQNG